jgi:HD-like signal output (HDOD) protein
LQQGWMHEQDDDGEGHAMWNPLNHWRERSRPAKAVTGSGPAGPVARTASAPNSTSSASPGPARPPAPPPDLLPDADPGLDAQFSAMLLSLGSVRDGPPAPAELAALQWVEELAQAPARHDLLPRLPAVLPKLMSLARRDDVSPRELSEHLMRDPALVAEVIRIANSPRYRASQTLGSLQDAVMVLGQRGMNELITNVAMRPVFNSQAGRFSQRARSHLWAQASRCAHACAYLRDARVDPFDAYLAGMVVNAGLIPALSVLDLRYAGPQLPDTSAFHAQFLRLGVRISANIARAWHFPEGVGQALDTLGTQPAPQPSPCLAVLLRSADQASKRHLLSTCQAEFEATPDHVQDHDATASKADLCFAELQRVFGTDHAAAMA